MTMNDSTVTDALRARGYRVSEMHAAAIDEATALFVATAINLQAYAALLDQVTAQVRADSDSILDVARDIAAGRWPLPAVMQETAAAATDLLIAVTHVYAGTEAIRGY